MMSAVVFPTPIASTRAFFGEDFPLDAAGPEAVLGVGAGFAFTAPVVDLPFLAITEAVLARSMIRNRST